MFGVPLYHDSSHARDRDDGEHIDQVETGQDREDDEPEPEGDKDLLVDDVQGQDAHRVVGLNRARGTVLVESTLGDPGKRKKKKL